MESPRVYFVQIDGAVRGPVSVGQMREMAGIAVISPDTDVASQAEGPWARLATLAIYPEVFPVRRAIEFKPAQFEEINRSDTPVMDPAEAIEQSLRPPKSFRGREVVVAPLGQRGRLDSEPLNDVQEMVLEVGRRVAANAPPVVLPPAKSPFPRWPWFAALSLLGTTGILGIPFFYHQKIDGMSFAILGGWTVMFNGLLLSVMMIDRQINDQIRTNKTKMDALR